MDKIADRTSPGRSFQL